MSRMASAPASRAQSELDGIDDEVLGDRRQPRGGAAGGEQVVAAVEEVGLDDHRQRRRAGLGIEPRLGEGIDPAVQRAEPRRAHLDLGDDRRIAPHRPQPAEEGVVGRRARRPLGPTRGIGAADLRDPLPAALGDPQEDVGRAHRLASSPLSPRRDEI